ncbi:patatin-like phospholipase family protein [Spirillospora sp. NPDC050679]
MRSQRPVCFTLGGGSVLAGPLVGMLTALAEAKVVPDVIVGASAGAQLGGIFAARPDLEGAAAAHEYWTELLCSPRISASFSLSALRLASPSIQTDTRKAMRAALTRHLAASTFEDLAVPLQIPVVEVPRLRRHWFSSGPLLEPLLAASSAPGLVAPTTIGARAYIDGGVTTPAPVRKAVQLQAATVYVLTPVGAQRPTGLMRGLAGQGALFTAYRSLIDRSLKQVPDHVEVHVLPVGEDEEFSVRLMAGLTLRQLRAAAQKQIEDAYVMTTAYLKDGEHHGGGERQ